MRKNRQKPAVAEIPLDEAIRSRARQLWEAEGMPDDATLLHWLVAEAQIRAERDIAAGSNPEAA